jgi:DNA (cytosine-5)-methyltransferase 1
MNRDYEFGKYEAAVQRWEQHWGTAPPPTEPGAKGQPVLSPKFVEWLMGLPAGWVTDVGLSRTQQLKLLGNGVVPSQALAALGLLWPIATCQTAEVA